MARNLPIQIEGTIENKKTDDNTAPVKIGAVCQINHPTSTSSLQEGQRGHLVITPQGFLLTSLAGRVSGPTEAYKEAFVDRIDRSSNGSDGALLTKSLGVFRRNLTGSFVSYIGMDMQVITGISANGAGTVFPADKSRAITMYVQRTAGTTDTVDIRLEGMIATNSGDNAWFTLASITSLAGGAAVVHVVDKPVIYIRYNVVNIGTGNTINIRILSNMSY